MLVHFYKNLLTDIFPVGSRRNHSKDNMINQPLIQPDQGAKRVLVTGQNIFDKRLLFRHIRL